MLHSKVTTSSELFDSFYDCLVEEVEYPAYCAMRYGIYCDPIKNPDKVEVEKIKQAIVLLHELTMNAISCVDGDILPALSLQTFFYYAAVNLFHKMTDTCCEHSDTLSSSKNAFLFRIYMYILARWIEEYFYTDEPLEVIKVVFDKYND